MATRKVRGFISKKQRQAVMAILGGRKLPLRKALSRSRYSSGRAKQRSIRIRVVGPTKGKLRRGGVRVPYPQRKQQVSR